MSSTHTQKAIEEYLSEFQSTTDRPLYLALSLRERAEKLAQDGRLHSLWSEEYRAWLASADTHCRCMVSEKAAHNPVFRLGVKDTIDVAGFPTRLGLREYRHYPTRSASALRYITGGLLTTCKVATTQVNLGFGAGCRNPQYPTIDPSGSSTGVAVSVAAGICDVGLGTDVLGSVRWPASHCGVVGIRMTHDAADLAGVLPLSPRMDALGWVARTADDLQFAFEKLLTCRTRPASPSGAGTVGILTHIDEGVVHPEIRQMMTYARQLMSNLDRSEKMVECPDLWHCRGLAWQLCARDAWLACDTWRKIFDEKLHWSVLNALDVGASVTDEEYDRIHTKMDVIRESVDQWFSDAKVDFIALPADPNPPFLRRDPQPSDSTIPVPSDADYERKIGFTPLASFAGLPAIVLPIALTSDGAAPLALQILGRRDSEMALVEFAKQIERQRGALRPLT